MKKVLILANNSIGLLSFRKELLEAIIHRGIELVVSVPEDSRVKEIAELGCRVIPVQNLNRRGTNPFSDITLYKEYKNLIKTERPNIVLTYTIKPNVYGSIAATNYNIPYLVNITGLGTAVEYPGLLQKITIGLYKYAMRHAATIFFQNTANKDFFSTHRINTSVAKLIPGSGVNLSYHQIQPYPDSNKPIKFIFISRLMKEKGIEEFFAVAEYYKKLRDDVEFHILGNCEDDYLPLLTELQNRKIISYHGVQKDVRSFIAEAACLIHPTYYPEGMSNVVLEAAAAGRPVITTERPGCMEAVDDGISGFLFPERDRKALINCVERFLLLTPEQRKIMGKRGREKMEREFDRQIVVNAYMEEIEKLL